MTDLRDSAQIAHQWRGEKKNFRCNDVAFLNKKSSNELNVAISSPFHIFSNPKRIEIIRYRSGHGTNSKNYACF